MPTYPYMRWLWHWDPQCCAMPFIHSLSGRDTTSYPFFTGKKAWFKSSMRLDIPALEDFGENPGNIITDDLLHQALDLTIGVYQSKADHFEGSDLAMLKVYKFLNNKSTLLKVLPPTEDAFRLHVKRVALATIIHKNAHISKSAIPHCTEFGWSMKDGHLVPIPSLKSAWPCRHEQNSLLWMSAGLQEELFLFEEGSSLVCWLLMPKTANRMQLDKDA